MATTLYTSRTVSDGLAKSRFFGNLNIFRERSHVLLSLTSCALGANVYYHLEKYEEAIADCEQAIQIDPTFTKVTQTNQLHT